MSFYKQSDEAAAPLPGLKGAKGLRRILLATGYSCSGLAQAWRGEAAFRQECLAAAVLIPLGLLLGQGMIEKLLLVGCCLLVLLVELLNSAIEAAVDRVGIEMHELAGKAKDMGSAAVFVSLLIWVLFWGGILGGRWLGW